jgi:hypothetical protein
MLLHQRQPSILDKYCYLPQAINPEEERAALYLPYLILLQMWFSWPECCQTSGEPLTRHFTLTVFINKNNFIDFIRGGIISVVLSVG